MFKIKQNIKNDQNQDVDIQSQGLSRNEPLLHVTDIDRACHKCGFPVQITYTSFESISKQHVPHPGKAQDWQRET